MKFSDFDLNEDLLKGIDKIGFAECMEVQESTLKHTLEKKDVYVQSQTGSGKTAAFLVSILELFHRGTVPKKRALIIVPTRELAVQIEREAKILGSFMPYRVGSVYGGVGYAEQLHMLKEGYEIIIGTPGRLIDLEQSRKFNFKDTSMLVIDEADRLFDMGFLPDIRKMLRKMPDKSQRMTMLFSATLNTRVWQVAWEYMNDPVEIMMSPEKLTVDEITQELYHVSRSEKMGLLLGLLEKEAPENVLLFCNTKSGAYELAQRLTHNGYPCRYIIGDLPQKKRIRVIDELKSGELKYLVATDVAARGLHVDDLDLVVNYDLPEDPENYVHRIGRTARAGNTGKSISLACERFVYGLEAIQELIDTKIPVQWADDDMMKVDKSAGMHFNRHRDLDHDDRDSRQSGSRRGTVRGPRRSSERPPRGRESKRPAPSESRKPESPRRAESARPERRPQPSESRAASQSSAPQQSSSRPPRSRPSSSQPANPRPTGSRPTGQRSDRERQSSRDAGRLKRDMNVEERLKYYAEKYGEDFAVKGETKKGNSSPPTSQPSPEAKKPSEPSGKREKKGLIGRLFQKKK